LHSSDFVLGELLGCGSLGAKVYRAENRLTGEKVAVKVFDFEGVSLGGGTGGSVGSSSSSGGGGNGGADHDGADDGSSPPSSQRVDARESVRREVASWCTLTNGLANLLPVYGAAVHGSSQLWVVSQLQDLGSCAAMITRRRKVGLLPPAPAPAPNGSHFMPEKLVAFVLRAALLGLQQLYSAYPASAAPPPGHGSVKASSLLVSRTGKVVLSDRAARQRLDRTFYPNGRPGGGAAGGGMGFVMSEVFWMPPEAIAASNALPRPQDVWQLGILALELREGAPPHAGAVPLRVVNLIPMGPAPRLRHAASSSELLADFVAKCCNKDPQSRPTVEALLQHPFIAAAENTDPQELVAFAVEV
jgi:serine/threonine protein kinase